MPINEHGQPVGDALPNWTARPLPSRAAMTGRYCMLEALDADRHAADLFAANTQDASAANWTYLTVGPYASFEDYAAWARTVSAGADPLFFAVVDAKTRKATGVASYLRIFPESGSIEVGNINFSPLLQRTRAATEAMFLMMRRAFDELGYRRYEWKCDALNAPSRAAALRFGFSYEGMFRQALIYKGRNRDTAWFSIIDSEWPALKRAYERWLAPGNFDAAGQQRVSLAAMNNAARQRA